MMDSNRNRMIFLREVDRIRRTKLKDCSDVRSLFRIKYRGSEFNGLPFLLTAFGYYPDGCRMMVYDKLASVVDSYKPLQLDELSRFVDLRVFDSLLPRGYSNHDRLAGASLYMYKPAELFKVLLLGASEVVEAIIWDRNIAYLSYKIDGICNTQAFSCFLTVQWLMTLSKVVNMAITQELRQSKYCKLLDSFCPEGCPHDRFIKGEITSDELYRLYAGVGSDLYLRELACDVTDGEYDGYELAEVEKGYLDELYRKMQYMREVDLNMVFAYTLLCNGTYDILARERDSLKARLGIAESSLKKKSDRYNQLQLEVSDLKKDNKILKEQLKQLELELSGVATDTKLIERVSDLEMELDSVYADNDKLLSERVQLKGELASLRKRVRGVQEDAQLESVEATGVDILDSPSYEDMLGELRGRRVVYVGIQDITTLHQRMNDAGLDFRQFNKNNGIVGESDVAIVFKYRCKHSDIYRLESQCRAKKVPIIYSTTTNMESLVAKIYEELVV